MNFVEMAPYLVTFMAWFGGGVVSIVTGFGCGLFAMPIMLLCVPTEVAIPVTTVLCCLSMTLILVKFWRNICWHCFVRLTIVAIPGSALGVYILQTVSIQWIEFGFGMFLLCCVVWELVRPCLAYVGNRAPGRLCELFFGFVSGVLNGVVGMGGPALGAYAALAGWDKDMTRGTFGIFFGLNLTLCVLLQWQGNLLGPREWELVSWAVPGAIAGTFAGIPVAIRISQAGFMRLLLSSIAISGLFLVGKALI